MDGEKICQRVVKLAGAGKAEGEAGNLEYHEILNNLSFQVKLEEALTLAMEFHSSLQDFINWLTQAEQTLNVASRPSLILDTVLFQIDEHKVSCIPDGQHSLLRPF